MPQIFHRSANTLARASLAGVLLLAGGVVGAGDRRPAGRRGNRGDRAALEGRSRRQPAVQFILHESAVASVLPNIYDEATLRDFAAFDSGRALSEAEYERLQTPCPRDLQLLAATQV